MEFSRQEYWRGLPFPSPGHLPNPGTEPGFPAFQADSLLSEPPGKPNSVTHTHTHTHTHILFHIHFHYDLVQDIEYSFLCYTAGHFLSILCISQFSSVSQPCPTLCNPMDCSTPGLPVHHQLLATKSLQSCPTLCDPIDGSPPGSPVPGILQSRTLERVAISFSNA